MLRQIIITPVANGYTVSVGCMILVYKSTPSEHEEMGRRLTEYLNDPNRTERLYIEQYDQKRVALGQPTEEGRRQSQPESNSIWKGDES